MQKIEFLVLESIGIVEEGDDLPQLIVDACTEEKLEVKDNDIFIITSKVVSMYEERVADLDELEPSSKAERIARYTGMLAEEVELVLQEGKVLASIPVSRFGKDFILEQSEDKEKAKKALKDIPSMLVTERNGRICTSAGVDLSNAPEGKATLLPEDPNESAKKIRARLEELTGKEIAVIIADTEVNIRGGSTDIAIGCSGIDPLESDFGADDLFGQPKFGGIDLLGDEITGAAALHFGQTSEGTPVVIGRGIEYRQGEGRESDPELIREGFKQVILSSLKLKFLNLLP